MVSMTLNGSGVNDTVRILKVDVNTVLRTLKNLNSVSVNGKLQKEAGEVILFAEADEQ